jgi:DNA-binding transcriptional regulator YiaG
MTFATELKQARQAAGLSQSQLAETLGVHLHTVKSWERGRREPPAVAPLTQDDILSRVKPW